jgi:hypothetical protein
VQSGSLRQSPPSRDGGHIFAGGRTELEYLRHIGVLDDEFKPVPGQPLNLAQFLQQAADEAAAASNVISVRGPQPVTGDDGANYVPAGTALPYTITVNNPAETAAGQLRIVSQLDQDLDCVFHPNVTGDFTGT